MFDPVTWDLLTVKPLNNPEEADHPGVCVSVTRAFVELKQDDE